MRKRSNTKKNPYKEKVSIRSLIIINLISFIITISFYAVINIHTNISYDTKDWIILFDFISKPMTIVIIISSTFMAFQNYNQSRKKLEIEWEEKLEQKSKEVIESKKNTVIGLIPIYEQAVSLIISAKIENLRPTTGAEHTRFGKELDYRSLIKHLERRVLKIQNTVVLIIDEVLSTYKINLNEQLNLDIIFDLEEYRRVKAAYQSVSDFYESFKNLGEGS